MSEEVTFIKRKGGTVLLYGGRQFYKQREYKSGIVIWNCSLSRKEKCRGSATLKGTQVIKEKEHSCQVNYAKNQIDVPINEMKAQVSCTDAPIPQIYLKEKKELEDQGIHFVQPVPPLKNIKTALYTSRKRKNFKNVESVEIPAQLAGLLLAEYRNESCCILIFCSNEGRILLRNAKEFFVDGTFQSCPVPFEQLFTIHGDISASLSVTKVVPLVYILMSDKKQESYAAAFAMIKSQIPDWTPIKIHLDFEIAIANVLVDIFPKVQLKKCFYHLSKAIWKNATRKIKIKTKTERRIVGLCAALALLPENLIEDGIDCIKTESPSTQKIAKMLFSAF